MNVAGLLLLLFFATQLQADAHLPNRLTADLDGDRSVTFDDFFILVDQFGQSCADDCGQLTADLDGDQSVTFDDFFILVDQFGLTLPASTTALGGRVLDTNAFVEGVETPIVGATVSLLGTEFSSLTDAEGRFSFQGIPAEGLVLDIDASTAQPGPDGAAYAGFREAIAVEEGLENEVARPFYLPRLDTASLTVIDPDTTTMVVNAALNIALEVVANSAFDGEGNPFTGALSITEVPDALAPAALPENLQPGLLITVQPVGITFDPPAPIAFPNTDELTPGSEVDLWSLDPADGTFGVVGRGRVSTDGAQIEMIAGGVRATDWHMMLPPDLDIDEEDQRDFIDYDRCVRCNTGSTTALSNGNLQVEHALPTYRSLETERGLRLVYNSQTADPRPVVDVVPRISARSAVPLLVSVQLQVDGRIQGDEVFTRTLDLNESLDEPLRLALQVEGASFATGRYPFSLTLNSHFAFSSVGRTAQGQVLIYNEQNSPFGAGWGLDGLQRLYPQADGSALIAEGDGALLFFDAAGVPLLDDDFDDENDGSVRLPFNDLTHWDITRGNVDLIGVVGGYTLLDIEGLYLDLDGTTTVGSRLESKDEFVLDPGTYDLSLSLAGNQVVDNEDRVVVELADVFREEIIIKAGAYRQPLRTLRWTIEVTSATRGKLILDTAGDDRQGPLLDALSLRRRAAGTFHTPKGDYSRLEGLDDGSFRRILKDGTQIHFDSGGLHLNTTDRNGNVTTYSYDGSDRLVQIVDPMGLETQLNYSGSRLSSVVDPVETDHGLRTRRRRQSGGDHRSGRHGAVVCLRRQPPADAPDLEARLCHRIRLQWGRPADGDAAARRQPGDRRVGRCGRVGPGRGLGRAWRPVGCRAARGNAGALYRCRGGRDGIQIGTLRHGDLARGRPGAADPDRAQQPGRDRAHHLPGRQRNPARIRRARQCHPAH